MLILCKAGVKKEACRAVLPEYTTSKLQISFNLREARHIFRLRLDASAQITIRKVYGMILIDLKQRHEDVFFDMNFNGEGWVIGEN